MIEWYTVKLHCLIEGAVKYRNKHTTTAGGFRGVALESNSSHRIDIARPTAIHAPFLPSVWPPRKLERSKAFRFQVFGDVVSHLVRLDVNEHLLDGLHVEGYPISALVIYFDPSSFHNSSPCFSRSGADRSRGYGFQEALRLR